MEEIIQKEEITNIFIDFDKRENKRKIFAIKFKEVENVLEYSSFTDNEYYSNFENLLLQWMNFQETRENINSLSEIFLENVEFEKKKIEEVLMVANSKWAFIYKNNFNESISKVIS